MVSRRGPRLTLGMDRAILVIMRIVMANDHGAVSLKMELKSWLEAQGHLVTNLGVDTEERVDYPDMARAACAEYQKGGYDFGILLCGTGIGISIAANKMHGIRCALPQNIFAARMAKEHNNANFIAFGGRIEYADKVTDMIDAFASASYAGGRHEVRVTKMMSLEGQ